MTETFVRPNGKSYRPRRDGLWAESWENDWDVADTQGCIVFGSLDAQRTEAFAAETCSYWHGTDGGVKDPRPGWWRLAMRAGERQWVEDPTRGAPGVYWTAVGS